MDINHRQGAAFALGLISSLHVTLSPHLSPTPSPRPPSFPMLTMCAFWCVVVVVVGRGGPCLTSPPSSMFRIVLTLCGFWGACLALSSLFDLPTKLDVPHCVDAVCLFGGLVLRFVISAVWPPHQARPSTSTRMARRPGTPASPGPRSGCCSRRGCRRPGWYQATTSPRSRRRSRSRSGSSTSTRC